MNYTESKHPDWEFESAEFYFGWAGKDKDLPKQSNTHLIEIATGHSMAGFTAIPLAIIWHGWYLADEASMVADVVAIKRMTGDTSYSPCVPFINEWENCDFRHSMVLYRINDGKVEVKTVDRYPYHTDGFSIGIRK